MMPAGDAEKDAVGRWWGQRLELMRDAIIYFRNNPSILFYESGNESNSKEHMLEKMCIRDRHRVVHQCIQSVFCRNSCGIYT